MIPRAKHATYFFLNKTWSLSLNLKPRHGHGILLNKQYKNLPLSLNTAMCLGWSFYAPRSRCTSNRMPWFNSKRWDVRESAYSHPSISNKCIATDKPWSVCLAAMRCCIPYHCSSCQNYHPYHIFSKGNTHYSQGRSSVRTPQDSFNELIIWKMNPLVVHVTGVKFNSAFCMRNKQWICYENLSVFVQIENLWVEEIS